MTAAAGALLGAACGLGLLLIASSFRTAAEPGRPVLPGWLADRRPDRLLLRATIGGSAAVVVGLITGWPVGAVLAATAGFTLPGLLAGAGQSARDIARVEAIAGWAEMLRDTLAGAAGLEQAITATAPVAPAPIRPATLELAARLERGDRLSDALRGFADDLSDPTADLVVAALLLAAEHQSRHLADLLGTLAAAARERASLRLRTDAGRARSRTSVRVIISVTGGLAVALIVFNRGYLSPYDSAAGQLMLLAVGGMFAAAFGWLLKMTRPELPARLLTSTAAHTGRATSSGPATSFRPSATRPAPAPVAGLWAGGRS